jgi:hypothetical protein
MDRALNAPVVTHGNLIACSSPCFFPQRVVRSCGAVGVYVRLPSTIVYRP